ncbi:unnamed protein product [Rotaria sp. Silwood2]|nr:unnamed protein product [Rotaria sp. Silwood2]CAF4654548.1 unnamed protein product [Rotaria sp. Silwood2]
MFNNIAYLMMVDIYNIVNLFNTLVREKYSKTTHQESSPKDCVLADQLFLVFDQLINSADTFVDNIITFDFDEYDDDNEDYQQPNRNDIPSNIENLNYSYDVMYVVV